MSLLLGFGIESLGGSDTEAAVLEVDGEADAGLGPGAGAETEVAAMAACASASFARASRVSRVKRSVATSSVCDC
jgi:hypothetical protein